MEKTKHSLRWLALILMLCLAGAVVAVPAHPDKKDTAGYVPASVSHKFGPHAGRSGHVPQRVLALLVRFNDTDFMSAAQDPDGIRHDFAYFERFMFHLSSYWADASHDQYQMQYAVADTVITLDKPMGYYGDDSQSGKRSAELVRDAVLGADPKVDYSQWDAVVLFHAGAGQEADINGTQSDELWSTFVSIADLREHLGNDDPDYAGIQTNEGLITEMAICPESEWQPDFNVEVDTKLGLLGVVCHQFGHQLGLPTLFDNYSGNGASSGVGNFAIMGTGAWNANGHVPPMPCAWSRTYLGWETPTMLEHDATDVPILHTMGKADDINGFSKVYKVPITDREYFLIENYCQNPDKSAYGDIPTYTFALLPPGQQDYYDPPLDYAPKFNFMTNSYKGSEWNFYGPGLGGPDFDPVANPIYDGSGLMIWHIDENIFDLYFKEDLSVNVVNNDSAHKGVDLEEADGAQQLDSYYPSSYMTGGPFDTFRDAGTPIHIDAEYNFAKTYFGYEYDLDGNVSQPTADSYYGGINFEIYNISAADTVMTFSFRRGWGIGYSRDFGLINAGESPWEPAVVDFDGDGEDEIFTFNPNGNIVSWKDRQVWADFLVFGIAAKTLWSWDEATRSFLYPMQSSPNQLVVFSNSNNLYRLPVGSGQFLAPVCINNDIAYLATEEQGNTRVYAFNAPDGQIWQQLGYWDLDGLLVSNLAAGNNNTNVYGVMQNNGALALNQFDFSTEQGQQTNVYTGLDNANQTCQLLRVHNLGDGSQLYDTVIRTGKKVYALNGSNLLNGYPLTLPEDELAGPTLGDADGNNKPDILFGAENRFYAYGADANEINLAQTYPSWSDTLSMSSPFAAFTDADTGNSWLYGQISKNRLCVWQNNGTAALNPVEGFPLSLKQRSLTGAIPRADENGVYLYVGADDGMVYRTELPGAKLPDTGVWKGALAGPARSARFDYNRIEPVAKAKVFDKDLTCFYPNPVKPPLHGGFVNLNIHLNKGVATGLTPVDVVIYDVAGNKVYNKTVTTYPEVNFKLTIPIWNMASGVYFGYIKCCNEVFKTNFVLEQ